MKRSKRYMEARKLTERAKLYSLDEAVETIKSMPGAGFDETIELHIKLGIQPSKSDQQVRGTIGLPNGTGKTVRVLVFARGEDVETAKAAGADFVGSDELIEEVQKGWTDFDIAIATPDMMREIGKLGRILGPRGLMPSPKSGTVTTEIEDTVKAFKAGRVEIKNDKTANLHMPVGKKSFDNEKLVENVKSALRQIIKMRPSSAKGRFIIKATLSPTMSPSVKINHNELITIVV
ncbi:MAG: 50S ribosomal protein L1 [Thermotogota bacterium]|nr:50S ribosomal protein L1 [Thermotogota bacterium]